VTKYQREEIAVDETKKMLTWIRFFERRRKFCENLLEFFS
jgi:hypothetical protein